MTVIMLLPRGSKGSIGEAIDEGSHGSGLVGRSGEGHGGEGQQSLNIFQFYIIITTTILWWETPTESP